MAATGLSDFGPDTFRGGLEILVDALNTEARLNAVGEHVLRERILGHLKQRLQIEDWYKRHPDIDNEQIIEPLIGIGLPRTGSTALSFLLAKDPDARYLSRGEAANPCPPPSMVQGNYRELFKDEAESVEGWKSHVPSGEFAPAECQDLMALEFTSQLFLAFAQIPTYAEWLNNADLTACYAYEHRCLKLLQWRMPTKPWRLKAPTHLLYLNHLNKAFPDARFVMTHRDPTDVMLSVIDVYADIISKFTDHLDMAYVADLNIGMWSEGMRRTLAFRDEHANNKRFFDIHFKTMQEDPVGQVRRLHSWLNQSVSEEFANGMQQWWVENAASREPVTAKRPRDYAVDLDQVRPQFSDYTNRVAGWTGRQ